MFMQVCFYTVFKMAIPFVIAPDGSGKPASALSG